ncbi:MAG: hypothetical protein DCF19_16040 [Pseudanabaena frigida]|uniref:Serine/threonine protein kinase n=1 Tax=Pseudanabaena frigida TaxID=945775 RepID=A0A2W4XTI7_9CYAN|nr:MAG: hypothetical protein DCF19_16040 [Pseudanabaena frigida]
MFLSPKISNRVSILLLSAIATGLFAACSNSNKGNNNLSIPAIDTTKVTPTATPTNATPLPTPANSSTVRPSPEIDLSKLPELEIGELEPYKHRSGILEMNVPKGWKAIDNSQSGELLLAWNEKAGRATIAVNIFVPPSEIPENRLVDVFEVILKGMYSNQPDFSMRSPVPEATGNVVIEWTSTVTIANKKFKFQANSKLQRINNKFVILTFGAIEPKFMEMKDSFAKISNSQIVNASLTIP